MDPGRGRQRDRRDLGPRAGNPAIADDPAIINRDPEGEGWFFKLKLSDPAELEGLMDEAAYRDWVKTL